MYEQTENKMEYVRLGNSGLKVSKIILGCMSYGDADWQDWVLDEEASLPHFKFAYDRGVQTWDTADVYSMGQSEIIVGKAIKKYDLPRDNLVIMTKVYNLTTRSPGEKISGRVEAEKKGYVNQQGLSRKHIFASVERSLERLQLDYIDLLQCHRFDYDTPIEETMQALHDVVQSGKVRYVGMSSCYAYQFHTMQNYAINNKLTPFISMQNFHNAFYREEEREMIPLCRQLGVGIIPWSPLARGMLTRPIGKETKRSEADPGFKGRNLHQPGEAGTAINQAVEAIAKKRGVLMSQVALAWSLAQPGISAPIIGSTSISHLEELIDGIHLKLTDEEIESISKPYVPKSIVGYQ
ncbi:Voltage-gated shaker-like K channel, subunit beta/KCNAB [Phaffia rhodozyma]|uniref:Voltage-gated shaker-like K channel, subunit beta/KCNAB n=1 Tax=Phaffia rhodozyma TaxID=264483 RepID=A0A0F7SKA1_PHARH|nr:Voltage-gated shaker-like K channel, subunit beta/KCNAB [Phaffia rhodozyma]